MRPDRRQRLMTIAMSGPFFEKDPTKTYRQNIRLLQDRIASVGEAEVRARLTPGRSAAAVGRYIHGRTSSLGGSRWATYAVVSATDRNLDGDQQRWVMALLSGRRNGIITREYRQGGGSRIGRNIGTTKGAGGRAAFRGAVGALRRVAKEADLARGLS